MRLMLVALLLLTFTETSLHADENGFRAVACEETYPHHLQGVCTNKTDAIYWSFTTRLVKTDRDGFVQKAIDVGNHHGDLCYRDGKLYIAVNFGPFNDPEGKADSWVYIYDADDLSLLAKHNTPEVIYGAGGIAADGERFLVVGGLPDGIEENYLYEYSPDFEFVKKHTLNSGWTKLGIQTATFADGYWWFGCYGTPQPLLKADASLEEVERFEFNCSLGIVPIGENRFLVANGACSKDKGCTGRLVVATPDDRAGLVIAK